MDSADPKLGGEFHQIDASALSLLQYSTAEEPCCNRTLIRAVGCTYRQRAFGKRRIPTAVCGACHLLPEPSQPRIEQRLELGSKTRSPTQGAAFAHSFNSGTPCSWMGDVPRTSMGNATT